MSGLLAALDNLSSIPGVRIFAGVLFFVALLYLVVRFVPYLRKRRASVEYQPAVVSYEGGGIKRGLTAPEAAVVLGVPYNQILAQVIFGLLNKGILIQKQTAPLAVEVQVDFRTLGVVISPEARADRRRMAAQNHNVVLQGFEEPFVEVFEANSDKLVADIDFAITVKPLTRFVARRIAGFDLEQTRNYYRLIIKRAPKEARTEGVLVKEREKVFDRNFQWLMLHEDFEHVLEDYVPPWLRNGQVNIANGQTFAIWALGVTESLGNSVDVDALKLRLGSNEDVVTATLINEIARATFFG
ncbi:MAG: hypothetical protein DWQ07_02295 [Chloroflexi bacterium]|nr:MAG: hypothetical protein DWQ07_02295 [Chloroflexota bacterium]MBL1193671.1 hypothetical protein [Chloroflexota bacterium]NOH10963.1 hypothetical protein [Chloroflexota bacterium]